ncbi:MAG: FtsX-like permease family protein [Caldilineaceae bacterium]|nr:FtsX-like permease family protein [Caldilineaceae bacterium]
MVRILLRKTLRTMMENKAWNLGAFFMVLISSLLIVGMTIVADNLGAIFNAYATDNLLADAEFSTNGEIDIASLEDRFDAIIEKMSSVDYEVKPGQTLRIFAENRDVNLYAVMAGADLDEGGILVDPLFADANGMSIGNTLLIDGREFKLLGTMVLPNYVYIIRSREELINDPKAFGIAVLSRQNLDRLAGRTESYAVRFNARERMHEQELSLKAHLLTNGIDISQWESTEDNARVSYVALEVQTLSTVSKVLPAMLLTLSMILIGILLNRMIQRESAVIGTLYALGYRRSELLRHYLIHPLLIAGSAGLLGGVLGLAMVKPMLDFFTITVFPMPVEAYQTNYLSLLIGMATPVVVLCLASYGVVSRLLRAAPVALMKGVTRAEKRNVIERTLKLDRFNFTTKFQIREQVRSLSRTGFLLFGVIVATMLLLYGLTLQSSLDYMLNEGIAALYNLKFEYVFKEMRTNPPPAGTEEWNGVYVTPQQDRTLSFAVIGVLPETRRIRLKDLSGQPLIPNQVIITHLLANKLRVGRGDEIQVVSDTNLQEYTLTIDAVADSAAGEFIFMPLEQLNQMLGAQAGSYIGLWTDEPMTFPEGALSSTKSMDAVAAGIRNLISQTGVLVYTLMGAAFILGLIIIFLVTGMIIQENKITISLFKVLGYRPKEVNRLILDSNTPLVVLGYVIGVPVLLASVTAFMQSLTSSMQMTIPARLNVWYMLLGFVVVMLTYQVARWLSKRNVDRISMSEILKTGIE